jgi:transposase InsO family protein
VLAERWRVHYNTVRPYSLLGYRSPAPAAWLTTATGHIYYPLCYTNNLAGT